MVGAKEASGLMKQGKGTLKCIYINGLSPGNKVGGSRNV